MIALRGARETGQASGHEGVADVLAVDPGPAEHAPLVIQLAARIEEVEPDPAAEELLLEIESGAF